MARRPRVAPHPDLLDRADSTTDSVTLSDPTVEWAAALVQPREVDVGSRPVIVVDVAGPVVFDDDCRVEVELTRHGVTWRLPAAWTGEPGQRRQAVASTGDLNLSGAGAHRVWVRVAAPGQQPRLAAGVVVFN